MYNNASTTQNTVVLVSKHRPPFFSESLNEKILSELVRISRPQNYRELGIRIEIKSCLKQKIVSLNMESKS